MLNVPIPSVLSPVLRRGSRSPWQRWLVRSCLLGTVAVMVGAIAPLSRLASPHRAEATVISAAKLTQTKIILKKGDRGDAVRQLQTQLRQVGSYNGPITGFFGDQTETAVRHFQRSRNLNPDGIAGQSTLDALAAVIAARNRQPQFQPFGQGAKGDRVRQVQLRLQLLNYLSRNANGNFDRTTTEALARFQRDRGLAGDGVVGQQTWTVLQNAITQAQIRDMQERLRGAGFYRGSIDGLLGTATQRAIEAAKRVYGVSAAAVLRGSY